MLALFICVRVFNFKNIASNIKQPSKLTFQRQLKHVAKKNIYLTYCLSLGMYFLGSQGKSQAIKEFSFCCLSDSPSFLLTLF